jgi:acetyltransferase-like isoleucine patch superfamily enzyme
MKKIALAISSLWYAFLLFLPDEYSKFRVGYYNKKGCKIHKLVTISPNVRIKGYFEIGSGSSIAQNCSISGEKAGIFIGENVMIAPNVSIVAFSHGFASIDVPMVKQIKTEARIIIEDNVWISSNCTIGKGVRIGKGSIISANSFVNKDIPAYSIAGGVPAKVLKTII